ncbi:MAG: hypothetical protein JOZ96_18390 [Acidobacteria bacterium]|nr:hypothetical protein [Acidobacteriota bacterium]
MKEANEEESLLRRYLLGELDEGDQESVEERFITDRGFNERVLVAEDELVEDYLSGGLSEAEKASFVRHFLSTPNQRRKVRLAGAIKKYMAAEVAAYPTEPGGNVRTPGAIDSEPARRPFWRSPPVLVAASLALLLAVALGVGWLVVTERRRKELASSRQELERLNRQPVSDDPRWVILTPLNVRGDREANVLQRPAGGTVVQLWLMLVKDEYQSYQVILQKDGDAEQLLVGGLRAETTPHGRAIPLRVPAQILPPGTFVLKLNGVSEGDRVEEVGEYNFRVTR